MTTLQIASPFNAPVYHEETVESTMDISRALALNGEPHGTVITADYQRAGRGRISGRIWQMEKNLNLPLTILLRYPRLEKMPAALTLRAGLAVSLAIEDFAPSLKGKIKVKWPNDILIDGKKAAGILCEAEGESLPCPISGGGSPDEKSQSVNASETGSVVHVGIGVNFAQKEFPADLREKAVSIADAVYKAEGPDAIRDIAPQERFCLLEKIICLLYSELETGAGDDWKCRLEQRLYKKGEKAVFMEGAAASGREVRGRLAGISESGELLIVPDKEADARAFVTGELVI